MSVEISGMGYENGFFFFSQSSPGANPIYSTNHVAGMATGRRRLGTNHLSTMSPSQVCDSNLIEKGLFRVVITMLTVTWIRLVCSLAPCATLISRPLLFTEVVACRVYFAIVIKPLHRYFRVHRNWKMVKKQFKTLDYVRSSLRIFVKPSPTLLASAAMHPPARPRGPRPAKPAAEMSVRYSTKRIHISSKKPTNPNIRSSSIGIAVRRASRWVQPWMHGYHSPCCPEGLGAASQYYHLLRIMRWEDLRMKFLPALCANFGEKIAELDFIPP